MSSTLTTGQDVLWYGDLSQYVIADHVGASTIEFIPNLLDQATGRPSSQRGFLLWWRTGANMTDVDAARQLRL
jgi:predicted phage gp36 major capsid-like protein